MEQGEHELQHIIYGFIEGNGGPEVGELLRDDLGWPPAMVDADSRPSCDRSWARTAPGGTSEVGELLLWGVWMRWPD